MNLDLTNLYPGVSPVWAVAASVFAGLNEGYAGFAAIRSAQEERRSQASALDFRARMLQFDRRAAEKQAESILAQGQSEIANVTLAGGQRRADIEAATAARGVEAGAGGNVAEVQASERIIEQAEVYHINLASVQAANAARRGAVAAGNEALFSRTSARNLRRSARRAAPESALLSGLGSSALSTAYLLNYRR
jgi:hypothetical protein